ncbi:MAG: DoxX family protein [Maribacter sp.]
MNLINIFYRITLGIFTIAIGFSIYRYVFQYEEAVLQFNELGYPEHLVGLLALAQVLGLFIIIRDKGKYLPEWAYTGFFINFICAFFAHFFSKHGNGAAAVFGMIILAALYMLNKRRKLELSNSIELSS